MKRKDIIKVYQAGPEAVIETCEKKRITQKQLASLVDTKQPSISRFESGEITPSLEFLKKIADVLDSEIDIKIIPKAG